MDVTTILEDGTTHRGRGEIHAGWNQSPSHGDAIYRARGGVAIGLSLDSTDPVKVDQLEESK
jgi:hypothetical protein